MRYALLLLAVPVFLHAEPTAGLWQLPGKAFWVQVNADRTALLCTSHRDSTVHPSSGVLAGVNAIDWRNGLGRTGVEFRGNNLVITAGRDSFELAPAKDPVPRDCVSRPPATIAGLWQFPGRAWWIRIGEDGSAFACRVIANQLQTAQGRIDAKGRITWGESPGGDATLVDGSLSIKAPEGGGTYEPSAVELPDMCFSRKPK